MIQRFPKYQLRYTRLFEQDLMRAAQYIDQVLDNPTAAQKLVDDTEKAILERLNFAESFEPYPSTKQREYPYYHIYVHNCTVFYVVIDGVMEVRRFLYSAQDIPRIPLMPNPCGAVYFLHCAVLVCHQRGKKQK